MLFALACAGAVIWIGIFVAPWRPWGTRERLDALPSGEDALLDLSSVTALIPARDEAKHIGRTIASLTRQGTGLRIVVVDDQSTDGTGDIARAGGGDRCTVVSGTALPSGWVGKLWALEQGRAAVRTPLILLIDADIELQEGLVTALLAQRGEGSAGATHATRATAGGVIPVPCRSLVSLMAVLEMHSAWEKLLVPAFVYFFKLLYPFRLSNGPGSLVAAAAGGCILLDADALVRIGGFGALRGALIDDCELARRVKRAGGRTWIGLTHSVVSHRRMHSLRDIWRMVQRSAYAQLRYSPWLLVACVGLLAIAFWVPVAAIVVGDARTRLLGVAAFAAMVVTYVPTLAFYRRSPLWALALPLTGTLYLLMTVTSAARHWRGLGAVWKGRAYPLAHDGGSRGD